MATSVSLGNFFQSNGRTVVGGLGGSGLDTESLVNSLVEARGIPKTKIEGNIKVNDSKLTAFSELKTLLSTFKDASNFLRNPSGVQNSSDNVFEYRDASVNSSTSVAGSSYLSVDAAPGAPVSTFTITDIISVARARKQNSNNFAIANADTSIVTAGATPGFFQAGTFNINGHDITLAANDSLNTVVAKFNEKSADTNIRASVLQVSSGNYRIVFTATETGTDTDFDLDNGDTASVVDPGGVLAGLTFTDVQDASDAEFVLDGVTITRSSNAISDAVSGVTFTLLQPTPLPLLSTTITVDITADESIAKSGIINFINAYNDLRVFLAEQSETDPKTGKYVETAVLSNDPVFRSLVNSLSTEVSNTVAGIDTDDYDALSDIGITFTDLPQSADNPFTRNIMNLDESDLDTALASNFEGVQALFGFTYSSNNANFRIFSHTNALDTSEFTLNIDPGTDTYTATVGADTITLTATTLASGGWKLVAPAGSALEGLNMLYASNDAATITVSATQGIADRIYNFLDTTLTSTTGAVDSQVESIKGSTTRYEDEITRIDTQLDAYREQLIRQFASLESLLSSVNTLLTALDAQNQARYANN